MRNLAVVSKRASVSAGVTPVSGTVEATGASGAALALDSHVDGLETLATSLNGFVDGLETLLAATNALLTTQAGYVDGLEAALAGVLTFKAGLLSPTDLSEVAIDFNTASTVSLVSATGGQTTRIHRLFVVVGGSTNLTFQSASTALHGVLPMQTGGSFVLDFDQRPWFTTATNEAFQITSSSAVQVSGRIYYVKSA